MKEVIIYLIVAFIIAILIGKRLKKGSSMPNIHFNQQAFSDALGEAESSSDYSVENSVGALGKYQFMPYTLSMLMDKFELPDWTPKENFLAKPSLQETYFDKWMSYLLGSFDSVVFDSIGTVVSGRLRYPNLTTQSNIYGLLAGAHLGGVGGLKKFILNISDPDDGSTSVSDYVAFFSDSLQKYS